MTSGLGGGGGHFREPKVGTPSPTEKSPDLTHYFHKRVPFIKIKTFLKKSDLQGAQTFRGPKANPPTKPEKSPNLTDYFSKGTQFNYISGPTRSHPGIGIYAVRGDRSPLRPWFLQPCFQ